MPNFHSYVTYTEGRKVSHGHVFSINQDSVSGANTVLHSFKQRFRLCSNFCHLFHLCCLRAVHVLLSRFLNKCSNLFFNSANKICIVYLLLECVDYYVLQY